MTTRPVLIALGDVYRLLGSITYARHFCKKMIHFEFENKNILSLSYAYS